MDKTIAAHKVKGDERTLPFLFCALEYIDIDTEPEKEVEVLDGLMLTKIGKSFHKNLDQNFRTTMGTKETGHLENCTSYCHAPAEYQKNFNAQEELVTFSLKVSMLKTILWLIKDNSIHYNASYVQYRTATTIITESLQLTSRCSNCTGKIAETSYSREDISNLKSICKNIKFKQKIIEIVQPTFKEKTRLHLFLYHLDHARGSRDLSFKIMNYCTAFQTLFETSTFDTSHQLAKRIALFMSGEQEERLMMYHKIKEAFRVHFLVSHGEKIKPALQERLTDTSQYCDSMARKLFLKISSNAQLSKTFKSGTKSIDNYFTKLMFTS